MPIGKVLKVLYHGMNLGSSRFAWEMQLVRTRNGLSFRFGIEDGHRPTTKGHTRNWQISWYYDSDGDLEYYRVPPVFDGDRRIGPVMMTQMRDLVIKHSAIIQQQN